MQQAILALRNILEMKTINLFLLFIIVFPAIQAQNLKQKKPVDFTVWDSWKTIENHQISNNGKWVSYEIKPYKGDGRLWIHNPEKNIKSEVERGTRAIFSPGSNYLVYKIDPQADTIRRLKYIKAKKEKFPKDTLCIRLLQTSEVLRFENLKSYKLPDENSEWMAFQLEKKPETPDPKAKKLKDAPEVFNLTVMNPVTRKMHEFGNVTDYGFSKNGKLLGFVQVIAKDSILSVLHVFDTEKETTLKIFEKAGFVKNLTMDEAGMQIAFLFTNDSTEIKIHSLYHWKNLPGNISEEIIGKNSAHLPKDWIISEFGNLTFSRSGSRLYFGSAKKAEPAAKDTLLEEEKVGLDLWSWMDPLLQSQQLIELRKEQRRNYLSVYHINRKEVAMLADETVQEITMVPTGDADYVLGVAESPYYRERSWSYPWFKDVYLIDVNTGTKKMILEKTSFFIESSAASIEISPLGNFVFWYENMDSCWYTINTRTGKKTELTKKIPVNFYDEEFDRPSVPPSYNYAGWTENDKYILIYDMYDIWRIDPNGIENPVCITNGYGRKNKIEFRYVRFDKDELFINTKGNPVLSAFNKQNKQGGFFTINLKKIADPVKLLMDNFEYLMPFKAKSNTAMVWKKSSIKEFPDVWYSSNWFANPVKLSLANPQQEDYIWATAEMVKWFTFEGKEEEGILYKPENFEQGKRYPMVVTFYELRSDRLHTHYYPRPSRSPLNILEYTSNGYLVFVPNIRYAVGNPGESAVNYVVSGTKAMINKGFVDQNRIGIQGQSWGAYQVAYIITQTDLFKAACAFSPVSNMTSAYGEIVWQFGYSRMSMYESAQSRIGTTLWEKPELYVQNSPIFYADNIETPLMMVHNDADATVPWHQGIALFVALRRLNKPCWLLNYNGEPHNLRDKSPDTKDFSIRMFQFFNHYLKSQPAPDWMKEGIPALKKGKEMGYDIKN